jgi:hypothetical protein
LDGIPETLEEMRRLWSAEDTELLSRGIKTCTTLQHCKALMKPAGLKPNVLSS